MILYVGSYFFCRKVISEGRYVHIFRPFVHLVETEGHPVDGVTSMIKCDIIHKEVYLF